MNDTFNTWEEVLEYAKTHIGQSMRYKAPMDLRAVTVKIVKVAKDGKIRLNPWSKDADAFTADAGHLDRMRKFA